MTSDGSSPKRGNVVAEALGSPVADQRVLRPDPPMRSVEEFVAFLEQVEAVVGRDERPRRPTTGDCFLL